MERSPGFRKGVLLALSHSLARTPSRKLISRTKKEDHMAQPTPGLYTVQPGDSLFAIAQRFYGDGNQWHRSSGHRPHLLRGPAGRECGREFKLGSLLSGILLLARRNWPPEWLTRVVSVRGLPQRDSWDTWPHRNRIDHQATVREAVAAWALPASLSPSRDEWAPCFLLLTWTMLLPVKCCLTCWQAHWR